MHAAEQERPDVATARNEWRQNKAKLNAGKLIFLDETWTTTNMVRLYGRAPCGRRLIEAVPHGHWHISTFIGGLRQSGIVAPCVIDGAVDGAMFVAYIEQVLVPEVRSAIEAAGANLLYLPPYSPDLNPIEMAFSKLKSLLRAKALRTMDELWKALGPLSDTFSQSECVNYLRHAGYFQSA
jgi:transposase